MEYGEETLKRCLPIARKVVAGLARRYSYLDREDLEGEARMRLLDVLKDCDLDRMKEDTSVEGHVYTKLRFRMIDYIRNIVGRFGQKSKLCSARSLNAMVRPRDAKGSGVELSRVVASQITSSESPSETEMSSEDAVERLLRVLPKKHANILRQYLRNDALDGGPEGGKVTRQVMAEYSVGESYVCILRNQALGWLRDLGEAEVKRILLGVEP